MPEGKLPFFVGTALMGEGDVIKDVPQKEKVGVITSGSIEEVGLGNYTLEEAVPFGELKVLWFLKN